VRVELKTISIAAVKHNSQATRSMQFEWQTEVPCKRRSSVNSGAWLRMLNDVTGVEKIWVANGINRKKVKEKYFIIANKYSLNPNIYCMDLCVVWKFCKFTIVETYFLSPNRCETQISKNYQSLEKTHFTVVWYHILQ